MAEESFEIEQRGYESGSNPFMGEWRKTFNFPPVSYANKSELKQEFKNRVRNELGNKFVYFHQVTLIITLYLNHEKILETPEYGDLDNYAKSICDALKGNGGIMIDDCQIQRFDISWVDVPKESFFEIELRSSPDDFMPVELKLYQMPDNLYYPVSNLLWDSGSIIEVDPINKYLELKLLSAMTSTKRTLRHQIRQAGTPQFRAFQYGRRFSPMKWAFHPTRVADSSYQLVSRKEWESEYRDWAAQNENSEKVVSIDEFLVGYVRMLELSAGIALR
jgi:Holliday junction resolvase RusA-like endonuclease